MAVITFPRNLPADLPLVGASFVLKPMAALSPLRSGKTISMNLGPELWMPEIQTGQLEAAAAGEARAWYDTLLSNNEFFAYDAMREYPLAYADTGFDSLLVGASPFSGSCVLSNVESNGVQVDLASLPIGFVLSPGDYLSFDYLSGAARALHRVSALATANGSGLATVEVRPNIRAGWTASASVLLHRAACRALILPDSYSENEVPPNFVSISFKAVQTL